MVYYRLVKGRLSPAPDNIRALIGSPTQRQYLFFGYKPIEDTCPELENAFTYVDDGVVIKKVRKDTEA